MTDGAGVLTNATATIPAAIRVAVSLAVGNPDVCVMADAIHYDTASSFIAPLPDHKAAYQAVLDRVTKSAEQLLVVGHTDDVGSKDSNRKLSDRRASGALAVLTADAAVWEANFQTEDTGTPGSPWADATFATMLLEVRGTPPDPAEVHRHRAHTAAGRALRATLFAAYFQALLGSPSLSPAVRSTSPPTLGCGEQHTLASGEDRASRRSEFFFVRAGVALAVQCQDYPSWKMSCAPLVLPPPVRNAFFVSGGGDDANGDGTLTKPWRTITHALEEIRLLRTAGQHVTLEVLAGVYIENVSLPNDLDLEGVGDPRPTVQGSLEAPTVAIQSNQNVTVRHLKVTGGRQSGIRIQDARVVGVDDCEVRDNTSRRGGGISIRNSDKVTIEKNTIARNSAGTIDTAITHVKLVASLNLSCSKRGQIDEFELTVGDAHGGGVYVEDSRDVTLRGNRVEENTAILFGGGIAVDNLPETRGSVTIEGNTVRCNQVAHGDIARLGRPAADCQTADLGDPVLSKVASAVKLDSLLLDLLGAGPAVEAFVSDMVARLAVPLLHGVGIESGLGGGIALRHVDAKTQLRDNVIGGTATAPNRARRGAGIECYTGAYPLLQGNEVSFNLSSDDGGGIAIDQFDPFLPQDQRAFLGFSRGQMVPRQLIRLVDNQVRGNRCIEDGGGLYATGGAKVEVSGSGTVFEDNQAGQNGGGIRVSYAVILVVSDARIVANQANIILDPDADNEGGGGVAARNADVTLRNCDLRGNVANRFAGGGVYLVSTFEGGFDHCGFLANRSGQFDRIMDGDFAFTTRHYRLEGCKGAGNQALGARGAGGYLYAVRSSGTVDKNPRGGVMPMEVTLAGVGTAIGQNTSEWEKPGNPAGLHQKRGNVVIELSGAPAPGARPSDRVRIEADVPAVPAGIALSTPSPDGRAVVVLPDGDSAGDVPKTFPYQNVAPLIIDVRPPFGDPRGGTLITISGADFLEGATVDIDGRPASDVSVVSASRITARIPPLPGAATLPRSVDLVVGNPDLLVDLVPGGFEYAAAPTLTGIDPAFGAIGGGTPVTIAGTGFRPGATVFIGSQLADAVQVVSTTELTAKTPPSPTGGPTGAELVVTNADQQSASVLDAFEYVRPPTVTTVTPSAGPTGGGTQIAVDGTGFQLGAQVTLGGQDAATTFVSATRLTAVTPAVGGPATVNVEVVNKDGQSGLLPGGFVYLVPPRIVDLDPRVGPEGGGTTVRITGTGFQSGARVRFSVADAPSVTVLSATEIEVVTPPLPAPLVAGPVDVKVTNPDTGSDTMPGGFVYQ